MKKKLLKILQPLGLLCLLGAFGVASLNALAVIAASFGFTQLFNYFQYLRVPLWSVALPALGIMALLPLALRLAFMWGHEAEAEKAVEPLNLRRVVEKWQARFRLRPV
jgi:phosphotransferase system  glucose/maltose/N-acetylglucosamine-specific IIC component